MTMMEAVAKETIAVKTQPKVFAAIETMIAGLLALKAFLQDKPELAEKINLYNLSPTVYTWDKKTFSKFSRLLARGMKLNKTYTDYACEVQRKFSDTVKVEVSVGRKEVCERIVTGTIEHPAETIQRDAYKEEIVEWRCK